MDQISKEMSEDDFHERVQPAIAGLFAVNDRGVRVMLLSSIPSYGKRLEDKVVNDQVSSRGIRSYGSGIVVYVPREEPFPPLADHFLADKRRALLCTRGPSDREYAVGGVVR